MASTRSEPRTASARTTTPRRKVRPLDAIEAPARNSSFRAGTKDANARANALAALIFIQFVLSLAQVWVASTRLRLAKKADEPAKASETEGSFEGEVASKEPSAEEPTSEKSSGCVAS